MIGKRKFVAAEVSDILLDAVLGNLEICSGEIAQDAPGFLVDNLSVKDDEVGIDLDDIHRFLSPNV